MSVRPSAFPNFSSTCFKTSIWNLVYTISRQHGISKLSCITIGSLWSSLQPKVGQTHFLQSWPHKSRKIPQIWYTGGLLYISRHKFRFVWYIIFGILATIFPRFGFVEVFGFFFTCFQISVWGIYIYIYIFNIYAVGGDICQSHYLHSWP